MAHSRQLEIKRKSYRIMEIKFKNFLKSLYSLQLVWNSSCLECVERVALWEAAHNCTINSQLFAPRENVVKRSAPIAPELHFIICEYAFT